MAENITCLGSGTYFLDTIVVREYPEGCGKQRCFKDNVVIEEVGGTCGNVMTMLPYLGVKTFPLAILDESEQGYKIKSDLERYGADVRFVSNRQGGGTSLLRCTHKKDAEGNKVVTFRATSPGSMFPKHKQLNSRNGEVQVFLDSMGFTPSIFFFDDPAAAHIQIAEALRAKGTLVYFEPEGLDADKIGPFLKRVDVSDVVKCSAEKIQDMSWTDQYGDKLFIMTRGADGVNFRLGKGKWIHLDPVPNDNVVDWEGAGDWTTSTFLAEIAKRGCLSIASLTEDIVMECLQKAQETASRSVSFLGSKGMIHNDDK